MLFSSQNTKKNYAINVISWKQCKVKTFYCMLLTRSDMQPVDYRHLRWFSVVARVSRLLQTSQMRIFAHFVPQLTRFRQRRAVPLRQPRGLLAGVEFAAGLSERPGSRQRHFLHARFCSRCIDTCSTLEVSRRCAI